MEFGSLLFIFLFLPFVLFFSILLRRKLKKYFLVCAGFLFYFFGMGAFIFVLLFSIGLNYTLGILISVSKNERRSRLILTAGIVLNAMLLIYYKYSVFLLTNIGSLFNIRTGELQQYLPGSIPVGISFFTFVAVSYLVDIHRDRGLVLKDPIDTAFTFSFFPKVFSGPITFHHKFIAELRGNSVRPLFESGVKRFVYGLGKKFLVANTLAVSVDAIFRIPRGDLTFGLAWTGVLLFTLQIYIDFSGYTDMAIGLGNMLGFNIPENFNFPYISTSIKDFWKRWHITLSNWLQLYIFLPVAYKVMRSVRSDRKFGIRVEDLAYFTASFITMLLCGIWHGAEWTFVVWGLWHGFFLILEHWKLGKFLRKKLWKPLRIVYALFIVVAGWGLFRSPDIAYASDLLGAMSGFGAGSGTRYFAAQYVNIETVLAIIAGIIISFPVNNWIRERMSACSGPDKTGKVSASVVVLREFFSLLLFTCVLIASILAIIGGSYSPFIYFGF